MTFDPKKHAQQGLCDVKEACEFLGLKKSSVYNLMSKGRLPFVFLGCSRRIPRVALTSFTEQALEKGRIELAN
jgi:excisionase family DNA binding protein